MKHPWLVGLLLGAALALAACSPADGGTIGTTPDPAPADFYDGY